MAVRGDWVVEEYGLFRARSLCLSGSEPDSGHLSFVRGRHSLLSSNGNAVSAGIGITRHKNQISHDWRQRQVATWAGGRVMAPCASEERKWSLGSS